jgi:hypothetical protein
MEPLTLRYNNPGAVEFKPWMSAYGATLGPNGRYAQFPGSEQGYQVMSRILDTYQNKHGLNNVAGIVNRWAPPQVDRNSTAQYIANVSRSLGVDPNSPLSPEQRPNLMRAMAAYEAGRAPASLGGASQPAASSPPSQFTPSAGSSLMAQSFNGWTPESVQYGRGLGGQLVKQGVDTSPVQHWTQALARVLQAGSGAAWSQQANEGEQAGKQGVADIYRQGLNRGDGMNKIAAALLGNPFGADDGQKLAQQHMMLQAKGPELTDAQRNFAYGVKNPDFAKREIELKQASRPQVNIDQKGETTFASESAKATVKRLDENIQQGQTARAQGADIDRLDELSMSIGTQGAAAQIKAALGPYANALGIKIDGLDEVQAFTGIVSKLAPLMRPPGSGATSDFEFRQYLAALPQLAQTVEGRKLILDQMRALNNHKVAVGEISERVIAGEIDRKSADAEIRKLGNPLGLWRQKPEALPPTPQAAPQQGAPVVNMGNQIIEQGRQMIQSGQINPQAAIESAMRAIENGVDRSAVIQRLQTLGIPVPFELMQPAAPQPVPQRRGTLNREVIRNG